jgi:hypothetical protein
MTARSAGLPQRWSRRANALSTSRWSCTRRNQLRGEILRSRATPEPISDEADAPCRGGRTASGGMKTSRGRRRERGWPTPRAVAQRRPLKPPARLKPNGKVTGSSAPSQPKGPRARSTGRGQNAPELSTDGSSTRTVTAARLARSDQLSGRQRIQARSDSPDPVTPWARAPKQKHDKRDRG